MFDLITCNMDLISHHDVEAAAQRASVTLRAPREADLEAVNAMWNEPAVYSGTLQIPWHSPESRQQRFFEAVHASASDGRMIVAEDIATGVVVGTGSIHPESRPRRKHTAGIGMMVATEFHGRGVGTALMAALMHLADHWLQVRRITLEVYTDNTAGLALYRKFGFEIEGTHVKDTFRDGEYVDVHSMARLRALPF